MSIFITGNLYFLTLSPFPPRSTTPIASGDHQLVLCIWVYLFIFLNLFLFSRFYNKRSHRLLVFLWLISLGIIPFYTVIILTMFPGSKEILKDPCITQSHFFMWYLRTLAWWSPRFPWRESWGWRWSRVWTVHVCWKRNCGHFQQRKAFLVSDLARSDCLVIGVWTAI